jgi:hypothetical protein
MHPNPQMSTAGPYCFSISIISGGLYHLVTTWSDSLLLPLPLSSLVSCRTFFISCFVSSSFSWSCPYSYLFWFSSLIIAFMSSKYLVGVVCSPEKLLERPKSHSFVMQSSSMRMFEGLMSLCNTPAECNQFTEHRVLYKMT